MCNAFSLASAGASLFSAAQESKAVKSKAQFESAQIEAAQTLAVVDARREQSALRRSFAEQFSNNQAAIAVSGFAQISFDSIEAGNDEERDRGLKQLGTNAKLRVSQLETQKAAVNIQARLDSAAAIFSGVNAALGSIYDAEMDFKKSGLKGETRFDFFKRSLTA